MNYLEAAMWFAWFVNAWWYELRLRRIKRALCNTMRMALNDGTALDQLEERFSLLESDGK